jgi:DNA-binding response OmpR family regulator
MIKRRILLVDDDIDVVIQNKIFLEQAGYIVGTAGSAEEAERKLNSFYPDIIVMDIIMESPKAGLELARKLTDYNRTYRYSIIFLTNDGKNPELFNEPDYLWSKVINVLDKPVNPSKLLLVINSFFERSFMRTKFRAPNKK